MAISDICGFELGLVNEAEGGVIGTPTVQTTTIRSGVYAAQCNPSAATAYFTFEKRPAGGTLVASYQSVRFYLRVGTALNATTPIVQIGTTTLLSLTATGTLVPMAGTASTTALAAATWYRIEVTNTGSATTVYVNGAQVATVATGITAATSARLGVCAAATGNIYFDDVIWEDAALASIRGADYKVLLLKPVSDNAVGAGWTREDGTTATGLYNSVLNIPPAGNTSTTLGTGNLIKCATSSTTLNYDANCALYNTVVGASDTVNTVMAICSGAQAVTTTSPKAGAVVIVSNPTGQTEASFDYGLPNGTAGSVTAAAMATDPTGWGVAKGPCTASPTLTVTSGPVVRVGKRIASTRVVDVDFMGVYVDITPAAAPTAPSSLTAAEASTTQINLAWTAAVGTVTSQTVQRALDSGFTSSLVTLTSALAGSAVSYSDTTAVASTTYWYRVSATNSVGTSPYSNSASATTSPAPGAPTGMTAAQGATAPNAQLSWTAGTGAATSYSLDRSTASDFSANLVTFNNIATTSYTDTSTFGLTAYWYRVRGVNGGGSSANSGSATVTTAAAPAATSEVAGGGNGILTTSTDDVTWTARTANMGTNSILALCYGAGPSIFVAGGANGVLASSSDGITWTARTSGTTSNINSIAWSQSLSIFVAVSQSAFMTSTDGITWTLRTNFSSTGLNAIAWSPYLNLFIVADQVAGMWSSTNGINWSSVSTPISSQLFSLVATPKGFIGVGSTNQMAYSADGVTWTQPASASGSNSQRSVVWSDSLALALSVGDAGTIQTSPDGITWTSRTTPSTAGWFAADFSIGPGLFVIAGGSGGLYTSPDGITWTARTSGFTTNTIDSLGWPRAIGAVPGAPTNLAAAQATPAPSVSLTWTVGTGAATGYRIERATSSDFVAGFKTIITSTGTSFTDTTTSSNYTYYYRIRAVNYAGASTASNSVSVVTAAASVAGLFVAGGGGGIMNTSSDGITWTSRANFAGTAFLGSTAYSSSLGLFANVDSNGTSGGIQTSTNGTTWTSRTSPIAGNGYAMAWSPSVGIFVAGGNSTIATSTDGVTWTSRSHGFGTSSIWSIVWSAAKALFVAVGGAGPGILQTSPDGINWTTRTQGMSGVIYSVDYSPSLGLFLAVGANSGQTTSSLDGITWTTQANSFPAGTIHYGVRWSVEKAMFVLVGNNGAPGPELFSSTNGTSFVAQTAGTGFGTNPIQAISWSAGLSLWVIGGGGGIINTSPDLVTWTSRTNTFTASNSVYYVPWLASTLPTLAPGVVSNVTATASVHSAPNVLLSWTAPSSGGNVFSYSVQRALDSGFSSGLVIYNDLPPGQTTWTDATSVAGTTYYYQVQASNNVGSSAWTPTGGAAATAIRQASRSLLIVAGGSGVSATAPATSAPSVPQSMTAAQGASSPTILLTWTIPATGNTPTSYTVDRATDSAFTLNLTTQSGQTASVSGTTATWTDGTTAVSTTYYYRIRAVNSYGTSASSNTSSATSGSTAGPSLAAQASNIQNNGSLANTVTFATAPASGTLLIACCGGYQGSAFAAPGTGPTWTQAAGNASPDNVAIFWAVGNGTTTTFAFTESGGTSSTGNAVWIGSWGGLSTTPALSPTGGYTTSVSSTSILSQPVAAAASIGSLEIVAVDFHQVTAPAPTSAVASTTGFTMIPNVTWPLLGGTAPNFSGLAVMYRIANDTTTPGDCTMSWTNTSGAESLIIYFK